ncbi:MAG: hypothetical protein UT65_C0027G0004 [Parcubacteria group bacterium GW2011_GWF2_39_8b]|uniref:Transcriptional repressor PaaX-like central Cas2-like domain-containing protein n=3 Tax=Candidatus Zambryskiibacteriota TaxID=1817925 RepID=A0A1G2T8C0_9BACT|nr:MAG: hypothetical protein UT65_C0027G0004 [Parcubacteria group bacterium GW2011_GWF2_39_8b]KKR45944.1 MAG: hypothetical protein UT81_C0004G0042 [Parcubacteria group bacterium GW2011_GWA2_40_14]OHA93526.1 MAG: hypothetical protein A2W58_02455 [Candidatus Zambryskibacteria bacterium RIFCSPHIGHO2_02_38_10.5]OHA97108.1 MAG: hypothetical protein A3C63_01500 [Candidatus Zambryskibacteria bacterium RIFCSPHIGHO2_02_FULL_39_82]OHA97685.1 MAG: hypothetical protein A3E32_03115 [Candidatus Zambryskibact
MGTIEERYRKRKSKNDIRKAVLTAVKIGGFLTLAMVAPNSLQYLKSFGITPGKRQKEIMARSRDRLVKDGLLKYDGKFVKLTDKGQTVLESLELKDWKIDKPKKWDGKWRMLIFDIPETRKSLRDKVRHTLLHIGFLRIQDSVWIYPYDCEDFVTLLKADFKIGKDLLYLIVDSIEYDKSYKKYFNLLLDN